MHTPDVSSDDQRPDLDDVARLARVSDAVRDRHRRSATALRRLEDASVVSVLLGAQDATVTVHMSAGTEQVRGTVHAVGSDVVELHDVRRTWWLDLTSIASVEGSDLSPGDAADRSDTTMADLLTDLVDSDRPVAVLISGGTTHHGTVRAVGASLWLRRPRPDSDAVIALEHVAAVAFASNAAERSG